MGEQREYPADLQAALGRVYETARPFSDSEVSALRAALNIALAHLSQDPEPGPDVIVMLVEAGSWTETPSAWWVPEEQAYPTAVQFEEDTLLVVCPSCLCENSWTYFEDGTEYRKFYTDDLAVSEDAEDFRDSGGLNGVAWGLLCEACSTRCSVPVWLYDAGFMPGDTAGDWGGAA